MQVTSFMITLIIQVTDGDETDIAVITITVVGVNDTPVAVDDTDSVNEGCDSYQNRFTR